VAQFGERLFDMPNVPYSSSGIRKKIMSFDSFSYSMIWATNANFLDSGDAFKVQTYEIMFINVWLEV